MADATLSTEFSRRSILAAVTVPALVAPGVAASRDATPPPQAEEGLVASLPPPPFPSFAVTGDADAKLALLAGQYRRTLSALCDWIEEAETRQGVFGYWEEPYKARYDMLVARADGLVAEVARTCPDSIVGLAVKLRLAVYCDDMDNVLFDCDERLMMPALGDLDRMVEAAMFGVG